MKHWGAVTAGGFGLMLLCEPLRGLGLSRTWVRGWMIAGTAVFFGGLIGIIAYGIKHPPLRCPACGAGLNSRHLRKPGGASGSPAGRMCSVPAAEPCSCPRCCTMI